MSFIGIVDQSGLLLASAKRLAFQFVDRLAVPAFVLDDRGRVLIWNEACARLTGVAAAEVLGTAEPWRAFYDTSRPCLADLIIQKRENETEVLYAVQHKTDGGNGLFVENWCSMPRRGQPSYIAIDASPIIDDNGRLVAVVQTMRDVTEHKKAQAEIERLAAYDPLTGLANRSSFGARLTALERDGTSYALLLLDIDRFKDINETLGHVAGDAILTGCASLFERVCPTAFTARVGGDQLAVVLEGEISRDYAAGAAGHLIELAGLGLDFEGTPLAVSFSIGIALVPDDARTASAAYRRADRALCLAKSSGGSAFRFHDPALSANSSSRRIAITDLRKAIERKEFLLHYQPVTRVDGEIVGFEALLRWLHPVHGLVSPAEFIPVAEQSGLIGPIGAWALREACQTAARWAKPLKIAVNLSPVQFRLGDIAQTVHGVLLETGLPASRLELELTESAMVDNPSRTVAVLRRLKALGVRIAMDDFGTGYSSLAYLQSFPFDKIKLDRSFIARLGQSAQSDAITRVVIGLGHSLSLDVLAEGVETVEQRDFLAAEGCDLLQGYLYGRPAPIDTFTETIGLSHALKSRVGFKRAG